MLPLLSAALALLPALSTTPLSGDEPIAIEAGSSVLSGKSLAPFDARWESGRGVVIHEESMKKKVKGRACYMRRQVWPMQEGVDLVSELVLDAKTLETVSFQREVVGLPEGASLGGQAEFARWEFKGAEWKGTTRTGGKEDKSEGTLPAPMFDGNGLGLVLAALPLEEGFSARLPVAMTLGLATEWTQYEVVARVVAEEFVEGPKGKEVQAWVVDVDWIDPVSGEVTSAGGMDAPGGAYFIVTSPPKGFPHVARYQNDSGTIELLPQEK